MRLAGERARGSGLFSRLLLYFLDETLAYSSNRGIPGEAPLESIAAAVLYLASDDAAHVTGVDLPVDGGAVAGRFIPGFQTLK